MHDKNNRREQLRAMLLLERGRLENRVKAFRRDQSAEAMSTPGDEMDRAKSLLDVETHASLIGRAEDLLLQIDDALARAERGQYGVCVECGDEISLARLEALPFTAYCVECKSSSMGEEPELGRTEREAYRRWTPPPELSEAEAMSQADDNSADGLEVRSGAFDESRKIPAARPPRKRRHSMGAKR